MPPWIDPQETFFITICTLRRKINQLCEEETGRGLLDAARHYHKNRKWFCSIVVLMPDHIHLMVNLGIGLDPAKTFGAWKRWTAKHCGVRWEENFFDHRVRHDESAEGTWRYLEGNPVRAGLVEKPEDWPWLWYPTENDQEVVPPLRGSGDGEIAGYR